MIVKMETVMTVIAEANLIAEAIANLKIAIRNLDIPKILNKIAINTAVIVIPKAATAATLDLATANTKSNICQSVNNNNIKNIIITKDMKTLNDYDIEKKLGSGQYGEVYKAKRKSDNKTIALKVIDIPLNRLNLVDITRSEIDKLKQLATPECYPCLLYTSPSPRDRS